MSLLVTYTVQFEELMNKEVDKRPTVVKQDSTRHTCC